MEQITSTHPSIHMHSHKNMRTYTLTRTHTDTHIHTHTRAHANTHTHTTHTTHTRTHTHTHTRTRVQSRSKWPKRTFSEGSATLFLLKTEKGLHERRFMHFQASGSHGDRLLLGDFYERPLLMKHVPNCTTTFTIILSHGDAMMLEFRQRDDRETMFEEIKARVLKRTCVTLRSLDRSVRFNSWCPLCAVCHILLCFLLSA
jgi:Tfp pilus assembly major pilin PilA